MAKKLNYPLIDEFTEYCSHMTVGSINCYRSYVNKVLNEFELKSGFNLHLNYLFLEKHSGIWNEILSYIYRYVKNYSSLAPKYLSGFLCYSEFISTIPDRKAKTIPPAIQNLISARASSGISTYTKTLLMKVFLFRLQTQNRATPGDPYYFPASLITSLDSAIFGSKNVFDKFLRNEIQKIIFLYNDSEKIETCPFENLDSLRFNSATNEWRIKPLNSQYDYQLYTVNPKATKGLVWNGKYCTPLIKPALSGLAIDHDPEIARILQNSNNNLPRLGKLTEEIDKTLALGLTYKSKTLPTKIQSSAIKKQQLAAVRDYWKINNSCIPYVPKLKNDLEYMHDNMDLIIMDSTFNGNKNAGAKSSITLPWPPKDPNYLP